MKKITELYVGVVIDESGNEAIPAVKADGVWHPACFSTLKNLYTIRDAIHHQKPELKFKIFKFTNREVVCSVD